MAFCPICWADAYSRSYGSGRSQSECYMELLEERKNNPCKQNTDSATESWRDVKDPDKFVREIRGEIE